MPFMIPQIFQQSTISTWRQRINWQPRVLRSGHRHGRIVYENRGIIWEQIEVSPEYFRNQRLYNGWGNTNLHLNPEVDAQQSINSTEFDMNINVDADTQQSINNDDIDTNVNVDANAQQSINDDDDIDTNVSVDADAGTGSENHADDEGSDGTAEHWSHGSRSSQSGHDTDANTNGHAYNPTAQFNGEVDDAAPLVNGHIWEQPSSPQGLMPPFPQGSNQSTLLLGSFFSMVNGIVAADHNADVLSGSSSSMVNGIVATDHDANGLPSSSSSMVNGVVATDHDVTVLSSPVSSMINGIVATDHDATSEVSNGRYPVAPTPQSYRSFSPDTLARMWTINSSPPTHSPLIFRSDGLPPTPGVWMSSPIDIENQTIAGDDAVTVATGNNLMNGAPNPTGSRPNLMNPAANVGELFTSPTFVPPNSPASFNRINPPVAIERSSTQPPAFETAHTPALEASPPASAEISTPVENISPASETAHTPALEASPRAFSPVSTTSAEMSASVEDVPSASEIAHTPALEPSPPASAEMSAPVENLSPASETAHTPVLESSPPASAEMSAPVENIPPASETTHTPVLEASPPASAEMSAPVENIPPASETTHTPALEPSPRASLPIRTTSAELSILPTTLAEMSALGDDVPPEPVSAGLPPDTAALASVFENEVESDGAQDRVPSRKRAASAPAEPLSSSMRKRTRINTLLNRE